MASNQLDRRGHRKLEDWLIARWEHIIEKRLTQPEACELANKEAGLSKRVKPSHLAGAMKAIGRTWPNGRAPRRTVNGEADQLSKDVRVLALAMVEIAEDLGVLTESSKDALYAIARRPEHDASG